jgi:1-acyl-sn-glycerol-3-phosphate acyltransferase
VSSVETSGKGVRPTRTWDNKTNREGEESILGSIRGAATLVVVTVFFLAADLVQRTLIVVVIKARPGVRDRVLTRWVRIVNTAVLGLVTHVGGAQADLQARIPASPGILVLMNHQSLLDIPVAIGCIEGGYPKIVARERYRKGYPLISHMIRLYGHPTVRPGEYAAAQLEALKRMAEEEERPVVLYPEGSRTPDGQIRRFRTAGLKAILSARSWSVYLLVADGMVKATSLRGFVKNVSGAVIRVRSEGPFFFDGRDADADGFVASMEQRMIRKLSEMRATA